MRLKLVRDAPDMVDAAVVQFFGQGFDEFLNYFTRFFRDFHVVVTEQRRAGISMEFIRSELKAKKGVVHDRCQHWFVCPENAAIALGSAKTRRRGQGLNPTFASKMLEHMSPILLALITDDSSARYLYALLNIFVPGFGPDKFNDMLSYVLLHQFCEYTDNVCRRMVQVIDDNDCLRTQKFTVKELIDTFPSKQKDKFYKYNEGRIDFTNQKQYLLPYPPYDPLAPVLLVPDFLLDLFDGPCGDAAALGSFACSDRSMRNSLNAVLAKRAVHVFSSKADFVEQCAQCLTPQSLKQFVESYQLPMFTHVLLVPELSHLERVEIFLAVSIHVTVEEIRSRILNEVAQEVVLPGSTKTLSKKRKSRSDAEEEESGTAESDAESGVSTADEAQETGADCSKQSEQENDTDDENDESELDTERSEEQQLAALTALQQEKATNDDLFVEEQLRQNHKALRVTFKHGLSAKQCTCLVTAIGVDALPTAGNLQQLLMSPEIFLLFLITWSTNLPDASAPFILFDEVLCYTQTSGEVQTQPPADIHQQCKDASRRCEHVLSVDKTGRPQNWNICTAAIYTPSTWRHEHSDKFDELCRKKINDAEDQGEKGMSFVDPTQRIGPVLSSIKPRRFAVLGTHFSPSDENSALPCFLEFAWETLVIAPLPNMSHGGLVSMNEQSARVYGDRYRNSLQSAVFGGKSTNQITLCAFNILNLGQSQPKDLDGMSQLLQGYDIICVLEVLRPPYDCSNNEGDETVRLLVQLMASTHRFIFSAYSTGYTPPSSNPTAKKLGREFALIFYNPLVMEHSQVFCGYIRGDVTYQLSRAPEYTRTPFAVRFSTVQPNQTVHFVVIPVHYPPETDKASKNWRLQSTKGIGVWIQTQMDQDAEEGNVVHYIVVGDFNTDGSAKKVSDKKKQQDQSLEEIEQLAYALQQITGIDYVHLNREKVFTNIRMTECYDHFLVPKDKCTSPQQDCIDLWDRFKAKYFTLAPSSTPNRKRKDEADSFKTFYSDHNPVICSLDIVKLAMAAKRSSPSHASQD